MAIFCPKENYKKTTTMSHKLLILLVAIHLYGLVYAQSETDKKTGVEFGFQHSLNFTHLYGEDGSIVYSNRIEDYDQLSNRLTLDLGLFAIIHVSERIAIQPEAVYSFMGGHFQKQTTHLHDLGAFESTVDESFAIDYIKGSLATNIKFNELFFIQMGAYGATKLSAERFYPNQRLFNDEERSSLTGIRNIDAGLLGGFGLSTNVLNLTFRYQHGLMDVFERGELEDLNMRNGVFQFVLHWKIHSDLR